jgi:hypothetical protein
MRTAHKILVGKPEKKRQSGAVILDYAVRETDERQY